MKTYPSDYKNGNKQTFIKYNGEWKEYRVLLFIEKKLQKDATYFTDDLEDAVNTAKAMIGLKDA